MEANLARSGFGGYAQAIENSPVSTLTVTGAMVGALWGTLLGWGAAKMARSDDASAWALTGALVGGFFFGSEGYRQGVELEQWLQQYPRA